MYLMCYLDDEGKRVYTLQVCLCSCARLCAAARAGRRASALRQLTEHAASPPCGMALV
jgi:hypothetical protein